MKEEVLLQQTSENESHSEKSTYVENYTGLKKPFFKKPNPVGFLHFIGFWGFIGFFLDKQEKIGKIIQKLSNLKP